VICYGGRKTESFKAVLTENTTVDRTQAVTMKRRVDRVAMQNVTQLW
jgi:hypothetical protein